MRRPWDRLSLPVRSANGGCSAAETEAYSIRRHIRGKLNASHIQQQWYARLQKISHPLERFSEIYSKVDRPPPTPRRMLSNWGCESILVGFVDLCCRKVVVHTSVIRRSRYPMNLIFILGKLWFQRRCRPSPHHHPFRVGLPYACGENRGKGCRI